MLSALSLTTYIRIRASLLWMKSKELAKLLSTVVSVVHCATWRCNILSTTILRPCNKPSTQSFSRYIFKQLSNLILPKPIGVPLILTSLDSLPVNTPWNFLHQGLCTDSSLRKSTASSSPPTWVFPVIRNLPQVYLICDIFHTTWKLSLFLLAFCSTCQQTPWDTLYTAGILVFFLWILCLQLDYKHLKTEPMFNISWISYSTRHSAWHTKCAQ